MRSPRLASNAVARGAAWTTIGDIIRLGLQAIVFFVLAARLGVEDFGLFAGTVALATIINQFSAWGADQVAVREIARDRSTYRRWLGTSVVVTVLVGSVLTGLVLLLGNVLLGASYRPWMTFWILLSDVVLFRLIFVVIHCYQGLEQLARSAAVKVLWSVGRFLAVLIFVLASGSRSPTVWGAMMAVSNAVVLVVVFTAITRRYGRPLIDRPLSHMQWRDGALFAAGLSARYINLDTDKVLVLRLRGAMTAGEYTAAYRVTALMTVPLHALVFSGLPRMFRHGEAGIRNLTNAARRLAPYLIGYGVFAAVFLVAVAPVVPRIFGEDFANASTIIRWLAFVPLLEGAVLVTSAILVSTNHLRFVSIVQLSTALLNVVLSIGLINAFSWRGAVIGTYVSECLLFAILMSRVVDAHRSSPPTAT